MILNAVIITFIGMGTVFIFLLLMVAVMDATRAALPYLDRLMPPEDAPKGAAKHVPAAAHVPGNDAAIAASIAAAYASSGRTL